MKENNKKSVLFLCADNAIQSQIAEALLKSKASALFDVYSAGAYPTIIDQRTIDVLKQSNVDTNGLISKHIKAFSDKEFDYVITLCETTNAQYRHYENAKIQLTWDCITPKNRQGIAPFYETLNDINNRLEMFLSVETTTDALAEENNNELHFDATLLYKSLTDEIRLKTLMLTHFNGELCVCELMEIMNIECQPKISRNLAVLKRNKILVDRKHGQWVFYSINPDLPLWAKSVIAITTEHNIHTIKDELKRLITMENKPNRASFCK